MQDSFYRSFFDEREKIIAFIGGGGKTTLIQRLSKDCQSLEKKVVILSIFPYFTPLEERTLISDDITILCNQINKELSEANILHIGKSFKKSAVENFSLTEIKNLIREIQADHIFIEADMAGGCSLSGYKKVPVSILAESDRYINILGADAFNQIKNKNWLASEDSFWKHKSVLSPMDIGSWLASSLLFAKMNALPIASTFFINKVENIYIENMAIPLAKNFKLNGVERVITGSVFNSNLHFVK
jgi:hypothetical protein